MLAARFARPSWPSSSPNELRDALIQQADKYEEYAPTKEKIIAIVEAKIAVRSPDEMDVDEISGSHTHYYDGIAHDEGLDALRKGGGSFVTGAAVKDMLPQDAVHQIQAREMAKEATTTTAHQRRQRQPTELRADVPAGYHRLRQDGQEARGADGTDPSQR